ELGRAEPKEIVSAHAALAGWRPEDHDDPYLPLEEAEAEVVIPAILFPGMVAYRDYPGGMLELVFTIGQSTGLTDKAVLKGVVNMLGVVSMLTVGGGVFLRPGGDDTRQ